MATPASRAIFSRDASTPWGDGAEAKATVAAFLKSLELRHLDAGGLQAASTLESAGLLLMGLARNGAGFDLALGAEVH